MNQADFLGRAVEILEDQNIPYMVVGSFASGAYGEPRLTQDIDIVIDPTPAQLRLLCATFPIDEFYVSLDAALQSLRQPNGQFNVIHPASGNKIDFMIARRDPWGREQASRRQRVTLLPNQEAFTARPDDIIISKMLYYQEGGSEKHLRDIAGILKISGELVDRAYVERWAKELELLEIWQAILNRLGE